MLCPADWDAPAQLGGVCGTTHCNEHAEKVEPDRGIGQPSEILQGANLTEEESY